MLLGQGVVVHGVVDIFEESRHGREFAQRELGLGAVHTSHQLALVVGQVFRPHFQTHRHAFKLPVEELPPRVVVWAVIHFHADAGRLELGRNFVAPTHTARTRVRV